MRRYYFSIILFCITFFEVNAQITFQKEDSIYNITSQLEILKDSKQLTSNEVLNQNNFIKHKKDVIHYNYTDDNIWLKFDYNYSKSDLCLFFSSEWLDYVELFEIKEHQIIRHEEFGATTKHNKRFLNINKIAINLNNTDLSTILIKIKSPHAINFKVYVATINQTYSESISEIIIYSVFVGIIIIVLMYNGYLFFVTYKPSYLYFTLFIIFNWLTVSYLKGYHTLYHSEYFTLHSNIFVSFMVIFLALSMTSMTDAKKIAVIPFKYRWIALVLPIISLLLNILDFIVLANLLMDYGTVVGIAWGIWLGVVVFKNGKTYIKNIFVAFAAFVIGGMGHILTNSNILPINAFTLSSIIIGSGIQVIFFSIALATKIMGYKREKYLAQKKSFEQILENNELIDRQKEDLESEVKKRTTEIEKTNIQLKKTLQNLNEQKAIIEKKNKYIMDGIKYAKTIQEAFLPPQNYISKVLPKSFIFFRPKDLLSGDFYWVAEKNKQVVLAVVDCEGHGVSGAMLSMTAHAFLNHIVFEEGYTTPGDILNRLNYRILHHFNKGGDEFIDSMDMSILTIDHPTNKILFSGARNPLFMSNGQEYSIIDPIKRSVGEKQNSHEKPFETTILDIEIGYSYFLFTDGYKDQFGGLKDKKFMAKPFYQKLKDISAIQSQQQKVKILDRSLKNWMGNNDQTDDILIAGIQF